LTKKKKDAHEFLCQVLDQLKDDADKLIKNDCTNINNITNENITKNQLKESVCKTIKFEDNKLSLNGENRINLNKKSSLSSNDEENDMQENEVDLKETKNFIATSKLTNPVVDNFQFQVSHQIHCKK
jgi:hypothetical protein